MAKVIPFKKAAFKSTEDIISEAEAISFAEGPGKQLVKGNSAWCVCGIIFRPGVDKTIKQHILEHWEGLLKKNDAGYRHFIANPTAYSLSKMGELQIPWPNDDTLPYDFLIATSTKPQNDPPSIKDIAFSIKNRSYFFPNLGRRITTFQDMDILNELLDGWPFSEDSRSELVEYLPQALRYYFEMEDFYKSLEFEDAVLKAGSAILPNGLEPRGFARHQFRNGRHRCSEGAEELLNEPHLPKLKAASSFEEIIATTDDVKNQIFRLGHLWSYDTAQRIALHKGLYPNTVYLQSGAKDGAMMLMRHGMILKRSIWGKRTVAAEELPRFLSSFPPFLIEHIFCVAKGAGWFRKIDKSSL